MKTQKKNEEKTEQLRSDGRENERVPVVEEREREHGGELVGQERAKRLGFRAS